MKSLPDLKGLRFGRTTPRANLNFNPQFYYHYQWTLGFLKDYGDRDTIVTRAEVVDGHYEFTVRFTREGQEPTVKTFQVGPFTRVLEKIRDREEDRMELLDIDPTPGLGAIGKFLTRPDNVTWEDYLKGSPNLRGLRMGTTGDAGRFHFYPVKFFAFSWSDINERNDRKKQQ